MKIKLLICLCMIFVLLGVCVHGEESMDDRDAVKIPVIMYHCIGEEAGGLTVSPEKFRMHLETMLENGYTPVSLQELVDYVDEGRKLPEKPVCVTFDDGYTDNYLNAFPILKEMLISVSVVSVFQYRPSVHGSYGNVRPYQSK